MSQGAEIVLAAFVIGIDNLVAALALGTMGQRRRLWRVAAAFTAFGGGVAFAGATLGRELSGHLAGVGGWIAAGVLVALGVWMLVGALRGEGIDTAAAKRFASGGGVFLLAATLSLDNLAVGFGVGLHGASPLALGAAAALSVLVLSVVGMKVGHAAGERWERRAHAVAGALLVARGAAIGAGWV
jgi:manganese efflux pump family protein